MTLRVGSFKSLLAYSEYLKSYELVKGSCDIYQILAVIPDQLPVYIAAFLSIFLFEYFKHLNKSARLAIVRRNYKQNTKFTSFYVNFRKTMPFKFSGHLIDRYAKDYCKTIIIIILFLFVFAAYKYAYT